ADRLERDPGDAALCADRHRRCNGRHLAGADLRRRSCYPAGDSSRATDRNGKQAMTAHTPQSVAPSLRGTRVLVMGLGVHGGGLGVARWLLEQGALVTVTDIAAAALLAAPLAALREAEQRSGARVTYTLGGHRSEDFEQNAIIVANPAVPLDSPWLARA